MRAKGDVVEHAGLDFKGSFVWLTDREPGGGGRGRGKSTASCLIGRKGGDFCARLCSVGGAGSGGGDGDVAEEYARRLSEWKDVF